MPDISLNDLIEQDKQKFKNKKVAVKGAFKSKFAKNKFNDRKNKFTPRNEDQNFKHKHIKKHDRPHKFQNKNNRDNRNNKEDRNNKKFNNFKSQQQKPRKQKIDDGERIVKTLKVMGLSPEITNQDLYKLFSSQGALQKCLIQQDNFGRSINTALVKYHNPDHAKSAIQSINKHKIMNCVLTVQPYKRTKN